MKTSLLSIIAASLITPFMTVTAAPVESNVTFKVAPNAKIHAADNSTITLADLKTGEKVGIAYQETNGVAVAEKIHVIGVTHPEPAKPKTPNTPAKVDPLLHARGVITQVNAADGSLTATVRIMPKKH
jgi:hypothetical protein